MKFNIRRSSWEKPNVGEVLSRKSAGKWERDRYEIEINSLEDLLNIAKKSDYDIIISVEDNYIEIYDDYRE